MLLTSDQSQTTLHDYLTKLKPFQRLKMNILIKYRSQFIILKLKQMLVSSSLYQEIHRMGEKITV